ncbi:DUF1232 domain-containing protein [Clostridium sp. BJN0001]|uniref:YkvA family protein n=1 Tax=Clostridium sp. BJN0001 TaxID=2930219 RepID=UPI001FD5AE98|nr:DUF1232 domain-containing protein [Clostridium sp. BJN0001]
MIINEGCVKATEDDIKSIIEEFIRIEGLNVENINIGNGIELSGFFENKIKINFYLKLLVEGCADNKISLRIIKFKVLNVAVFRIIRSLILDKVSDLLSEYGISSNKDLVIVDFKKCFKNVPYISLNIDEVYIKGNKLCIDASDINVSIKGNIKKEEEEKEENEEDSLEDIDSIKKVEDNYSAGSKFIKEKFPESFDKIKDYLFIIPDIAALIYRLLKDDRVNTKTKLIISGAIAYIFVPGDIIPDDIPFIGTIDDTGVLFFTLNTIMEEVDLHIIIENWNGENDILLVLKKSLEYLSTFQSASNVASIVKAIENLSDL